MPDTTADDGMNGLLDSEQVAARLNISERSVRTLKNLGHLPTVDMSPLSCVLFDPRDVEAFIEARRSKSKSSRGRSAGPATPPDKGGA